MAQRFANAGFPVSGIRLPPRGPKGPKGLKAAFAGPLPVPEEPKLKKSSQVPYINPGIADCAALIAAVGEPKYSLTRQQHDQYIQGLLPKYKQVEAPKEPQAKEAKEKETEEKDTSQLPAVIKTGLDETSWITEVTDDIKSAKRVIYTVVKNMISASKIDGKRFSDIIKGQILANLKDTRTIQPIIEKLSVSKETKDAIEEYLLGLTL